MAGTFFMMRSWTHLMLFFQANHHGTKVFAKLVRLVDLQQITMAGTFFYDAFLDTSDALVSCKSPWHEGFCEAIF
jgi:hypothetical protein